MALINNNAEFCPGCDCGGSFIGPLSPESFEFSKIDSSDGNWGEGFNIRARDEFGTKSASKRTYDALGHAKPELKNTAVQEAVAAILVNRVMLCNGPQTIHTSRYGEGANGMQLSCRALSSEGIDVAYAKAVEQTA